MTNTNRMKYAKVQEETLKNRVAKNFFGKFDCTEVIAKIDFSVKSANSYFLWAEAKADVADICAMLAQLILTIGKARTFDKITPPPYLGCFDREKIAFVPYHAVHDIFYQSDFNWKITPSNHTTREFNAVYTRVKQIVHTGGETYLFDFQKNEKELKHFIDKNFVIGQSGISKVLIDKNNFVTIYTKWLESVKPTIQIDWDIAKKSGIIDGDFYLADLLSAENKTLKEKLFVLLKSDYYELDRNIDESGFRTFRITSFSDNQKAHTLFWAKYERPPLEEYWDYIVERRDLLVPQDVRERKGSFFTPQIWVALSQKYIADVLGKDWQDEYYVWDCAAGTGNLLVGLTNKYNIWASTVDKADVDVMKDRIRNGATLLEDHVFQFDFLNDDFDKLPAGLRDIINDENKRRKLVIYINPPYAEATSTATTTGTGKNKTGVVTKNATYEKYKTTIGKASNEFFAQFLARIYREIPSCQLATFSKLKFINGQNFKKFREFFKAEFKNGFMVHANTFDNVNGHFPIGFTIWDLHGDSFPRTIRLDVISGKGKKKFWAVTGKSINQWVIQFNKDIDQGIAYMANPAPDFQRINQPYLTTKKGERHFHYYTFNETNIIEGCLYFAVRLCMEPTWQNDRDQFLCPNEKWKIDKEFQNDCLIFTLFHHQNRICRKHGVNHWIPFTENEVNARSKFQSNFMTDFIAGKIERGGNLFTNGKKRKRKKLIFSSEAKAVLNAGKKLWTYYHAQPKCNVNASLYDIKEHFQGRNEKGRMNSTSEDATYTKLIANLRAALNTLASKIKPKVYEYGFLLE